MTVTIIRGDTEPLPLDRQEREAMSEIKNAKIVSTTLGVEDHGLLSAFVHLDGDGWGCGFGGYKLDGPHGHIGQGPNYCAAFIRGVLDALEVERWEKLPGTIVRAYSEGPGGGILRIGHAYKDKWFDPKKVFEALKGRAR